VRPFFLHGLWFGCYTFEKRQEPLTCFWRRNAKCIIFIRLSWITSTTAWDVHWNVKCSAPYRLWELTEFADNFKPWERYLDRAIRGVNQSNRRSRLP
jgi:hypothetical protein